MILIILVLYKIKPEKSPGFMFCFNNWNSLHKKFRLVLYDNSPENTDLSNYSNLNNFEYYHDHKNHGLAKAYNYGLKQANIHNCKWLLLLDQDTVVNHDFFIELINTEIKINENKNVVAIIPRVKSGNKIISPTWVTLLRWGKPFNSTGLVDKKTTAINSGSLIRVGFLNQIKGFNEKFKLDMLDYWIYNEINNRQKIIYVLTSEIEHDMSFRDYNNKVSVDRYINFLSAEKLFFSEKDTVMRFYYRTRLFFRFIKQFFQIENKSFCLLTLKQLFLLNSNEKS